LWAASPPYFDPPPVSYVELGGGSLGRDGMSLRIGRREGLRHRMNPSPADRMRMGSQAHHWRQSIGAIWRLESINVVMERHQGSFRGGQ
jgi:hypothetical protein